MNKKQYLKSLEDLGLTANESLIYLSALSLGPTTVLRLAKVSEIERTNIYRIVDSLIKKGIMFIEVKGQKKRFCAENPEHLEKILELKKKNFLHVLPDLKNMYGQNESAGEIKYFQGNEGIKTVYDQLLNEINQNDFYYVISNLDKWHTLNPKFFEQFIEKRVKKNVPIKVLAQEGERARYNTKYRKNFQQEVSFLPKGTLLETDTIITPKKLIIIQLNEPLTTFVIENRSIIETHKQYFEIMWSMRESSF